jgi:hypothetical protein
MAIEGYFAAKLLDSNYLHYPKLESVGRCDPSQLVTEKLLFHGTPLRINHTISGLLKNVHCSMK